MRLRLLVVGVVAALAIVLAGPVLAGPVETLNATLTGEKEVPGPGDRDGTGDAKLIVQARKVCYIIEAEDIKRPLAAHIHEGPRTVAGPVVVTLNTPGRGSAITGWRSSGCERISRALSRDLRNHPGQYYVNVHNRPFPDGAIRGQLFD